MLPEHFERPALLRLIQTPRPTTRQSFAVAAQFAAQAILCSVILMLIYHKARAGGVSWAIISAVLVLQPGIEQAVGASAVRIAANLIGAAVGLAVGQVLGDGRWQVLVAMVVVIFACEGLRLDLGLRTACVSVIVVMMAAPEGRVVTSSVERFTSVAAGCILAVVVQMLTIRVGRQFGWPGFVMPATKISPPTDHE